jgi:hypothetical protein
MIIEKMYNETGAKWEITTIEECLEHTEGSGYWKKDSVLNMLKEGEIVFTPFGSYRMKTE